VRILVVEDEPKIAEAVKQALTAEDHDVTVAVSGEEGFFLAQTRGFDLMIFDIMLPNRDGIEILASLRRAGHRNPVLLLTSKDTVEDRVRGLDAGADDYLGKPFEPDVLTARARALLRRNAGRAPAELTAGDLRLDPGRRVAFRAGEPLKLTAREFTILELLMRVPGGVVSREEILEQAWGEREEPMSNTIDVLVGRLRRKLDRPKQPSRIETVRGMGYRLR